MSTSRAAIEPASGDGSVRGCRRSTADLSRDNPEQDAGGAASGKLVVEQAAEEADAGQDQDAARDAVEQGEVTLAEGFAEEPGAQADAEPPDQRAEQHAGDEHGSAPERRL